MADIKYPKDLICAGVPKLSHDDTCCTFLGTVDYGEKSVNFFGCKYYVKDGLLQSWTLNKSKYWLMSHAFMNNGTKLGTTAKSIYKKYLLGYVGKDLTPYQMPHQVITEGPAHDNQCCKAIGYTYYNLDAEEPDTAVYLCEKCEYRILWTIKHKPFLFSSTISEITNNANQNSEYKPFWNQILTLWQDALIKPSKESVFGDNLKNALLLPKPSNNHLCKHCINLSNTDGRYVNVCSAYPPLVFCAWNGQEIAAHYKSKLQQYCEDENLPIFVRNGWAEVHKILTDYETGQSAYIKPAPKPWTITKPKKHNKKLMFATSGVPDKVIINPDLLKKLDQALKETPEPKPLDIDAHIKAQRKRVIKLLW